MADSATYLTDRQCAARFNVSVRTWRRWAANGHAPAPRRIGPNTSRWLLAEVDAFAQRVEAAA